MPKLWAKILFGFNVAFSAEQEKLKSLHSGETQQSQKESEEETMSTLMGHILS